MAGKKTKTRLLPYAFLSCMLIAVIVLLTMSGQINRRYRAEAALSPTPSASPRSVAVSPLPGQTTPAPTAALLMMDSIGRDVMDLQSRLRDLGYYQGEIDGIFGKGTFAAVVLFQGQNALDTDGIVGTATKTLLFSNSAKQYTATPPPSPIPVYAGSLPLLVNRDYPLPEDYRPAGLVYLKDSVPEGLMIIKYQDTQGVEEAVQALTAMISKATDEGLSPWQVSAGYRSYQTQRELFDKRKQAFLDQGFSQSKAISAARQTVADPGASEHQTGLAFDITVPGYNFEDTPQSDWLSRHCWEYGFIIRYTDEKQSITGFLGEPWHIRFVGLPYSLDILSKKLTLEEYLTLVAAETP
jgi:LAS superfamily LD-carboxypeptidase LdcB